MALNKKIAIIHFLPLELYPPIMNLLDYLSIAKPSLHIIVFTTKSSKSLQAYENSTIKIIRFPPIVPTASIFSKLLKYSVFYCLSFVKIIHFNPSSILYIETLSALPALWYKNLKLAVINSEEILI